MTDDLRATPDTAHRLHDPMLVAALAAGAVDDGTHRAATELIVRCRACAALHADLIALAAATRQLPAPVNVRDFRLDARAAARLRSPWRRGIERLRRLGRDRRGPAGAALTALGVTGLVLVASMGAPGSALVTGPGGVAAPGYGTAAVPSQLPSGAKDAGAPAAIASQPPRPAPGASAAVGQAGSSEGREDATGEGTRAPESADRVPIAAVEPWLQIGSLALLALGVGLLAGARLDRRR